MNEDAALNSWLEDAKGKEYYLAIADTIFGGRPGELTQIPTACRRGDSILRIQFEGPEHLAITDPENIQISTRGDLTIASASEVVHGSPYYGRPETPENWIERRYQITGALVQVTRTGPAIPGMTDLETFTFKGDNFIRLFKR